MRLIYDMRHYNGQMHGMARYGLELLKAVMELEEDLSVGVLVHRPEHAGILQADKRLVAIACPLAPYGIKSQVRMMRVLRALTPDVYHCPFYAPPAFYEGPMVVTIHDLIHIKFPEHHGMKHRQFYRWVVGPAARRARAVFTVSRQSKDDIVKLLRVNSGKIVLTPNGVGPEFKPLDARQRQEAVKELDLPPNFILGVGNAKPHKNLAALVEAWNLLQKDSGLGDNPRPALVLVGVKPGQVAKDQPELIIREHIGGRELALAYGAARAVAVPSLYEGFGLPALEALACGAPVVASNLASLPEVVGKAGILCDPAPEELAKSLARVLGDEKTAERLRKKGPDQAAKFTWQKAARETLKVYRRIAAPPAAPAPEPK